MPALLSALLLAAGLLSGLTQPGQAQDPAEAEAWLEHQELITPGYLSRHLHTLAHDSLLGRGSGHPTKARAAGYLADYHRELGLEPVGDNGSYVQMFDLQAFLLEQIDFATYRVQAGDTVRVDAFDFVPGRPAPVTRVTGGEQSVRAGVTFAGFGAYDEQRGVDHHSGTDLQDRWVLVFEDMPHVVDGDTLISPDYGHRQRYMDLLRGQNAAGILLIDETDPERYESQSRRFSELLPDPVALSLPGGQQRGQPDPAYFRVHPELAADMLGLAGVQELQDKREELARNPEAFVPRDTGFLLSSETTVNRDVIQERNVAGLLEGSDPELRDEVIVFTAHFDHLGVGSPNQEGDVIYNGADDNASGTVSLLNIARAMTEARQQGQGPDRSVLFLHVGAEEWGLLGSEYYSENPTLPIEQLVANINVDMIGRQDERHAEQGVENYTYVIGADLISSDLQRWMEEANEMSVQLSLSDRYNDLDDPNQLYRRSDHWNFGRLEIPFIFFFSGLHENYHAPGDTPGRILYDALSERVRLIYATAMRMANAEERPRVDNEAFIERTQVGSQ